MALSGFVTVHTEQAGNRPPRKVYSITPEGIEQFQSLLRQNLEHPDSPIYKGDVGLMFLDHLPKDEVAHHLQQRLQRLQEQMNLFQKGLSHSHAAGIQLSLEHRLLHMQLEVDWLERIAAQLQSSTDEKTVQ
jgi:DNA-binding PadR family transcriptional regulator